MASTANLHPSAAKHVFAHHDTSAAYGKARAEAGKLPGYEFFPTLYETVNAKPYAVADYNLWCDYDRAFL
jgi:hypothetical protein